MIGSPFMTKPSSLALLTLVPNEKLSKK